MNFQRTSRAVAPIAVALACMALTLGGCQRGGDETTKIVKLAFVTNNTSEFWKIAANGVRKYEREGGVQVDVKMPPNGKTEEQNQILENLVSQGYDAIAVSVIAPKDQVPVLNRVAGEDPPHHLRLRRAGRRSGCSTSAPSTTRRARRSASGS